MHAATTSPSPHSHELRLVLQGVHRSFGEHLVLEDVSLTRTQPGVVGLLGANGSGKTTLLRIIAQLAVADTGRVEVAGRHVLRGDDAHARRLVGWAPHSVLAWLDDTVHTNLRYAARLAGLPRRNAARRAQHSIEEWELAQVRDSPVRRLSRGWQQRYALARADLLDPPILLLDEPTTGLDTAARALLDTSLERWRSTRIVIVATHEHDWIRARADAVVQLEHGRVAP